MLGRRRRAGILAMDPGSPSAGRFARPRRTPSGVRVGARRADGGHLRADRSGTVRRRAASDQAPAGSSRYPAIAVSIVRFSRHSAQRYSAARSDGDRPGRFARCRYRIAYAVAVCRARGETLRHPPGGNLSRRRGATLAGAESADRRSGSRGALAVAGRTKFG